MSQAEKPATATADATTPATAPPSIRTRFESKFPRGLIIRLIAYLFVGHLFAFFVYLLFVLGGQNQ
ncbi:DUF6126 family protein [Streptomyces venezuelae]|uniref:DUF6126 family protein n=1 Tax=Streptomyces venezuelae TaxID=54571 RepID=UPI001CC27031|nr:DUF6126 family protein [Streptomyces venezuelae]